MGQLVVGLGGAAAASFLPFPFGALATIGFALAGQALFPPDPIRIEGPRKTDLRVSSSTPGRPKPEGFGTIRLNSNLIWANPIREVETTQSQGGKGAIGGPQTEQVSYSYFGDFACAFAQGPAEAFLMIFADGKLIYDRRDPNSTAAILTATVKPGVTVRVYLGTETQLPCPTIEAAKGIGNTSAYRGTVYCTFDNLPLQDFGNRIPQITAVIAFKATESASGRLSTDSGIADFNDWSQIYFDWRRGVVYTFDDSDATKGIRVWDIATLVEVRQQLEADMNLTGLIAAGQVAYVSQDGNGRIYFEGSNNNHVSIDIIDCDTLVSLGAAGFNAAGDNNHGVGDDGGGFPDPTAPIIATLDWMVEGSCYATGSIPGTENVKNFLLGFSTINDGPVLLDMTDPSTPKMVNWNNGPALTGSAQGIAEPQHAQNVVFWTIHHGGTNTTGTLQKWVVDFTAFLDVLDTDNVVTRGVTQQTVTTFPSSIWDDDGTSGKILGPIYDQTDGNLVFVKNTTPGCTVWKYDIANDRILWINSDSVVRFRNRIIPTQYTRIRNGIYGHANGSGPGQFILIDTISGETIDEDTNIGAVFGTWFGDEDVVWDDTMMVFTSIHNSASNTLEQFFIGRAQGLGEPLSDVVEHLSAENVNGVGLLPAQYDVTDLAGDTVNGYAVTRQMSARHALDPLFVNYDFDATEQDAAIHFVKRSATSVASITQADLVAAPQVVPETRTQETELPSRLSYTFIDPERDYQENSVRALRSRAPLPTMYSKHFDTIDVALVLAASEAKENIERILHTMWTQRKRLRFGLGDNFIRFVPTDIIDLTLNSGSVFLLRILTVGLAIDETQSYEAVIVDAALQVPSGAVADPAVGFTPAELPTSENTRLFMIDAPFLRDIDSTNRQTIELKYAMAGFQSGWKAGTLWTSPDGIQYTAAARSLSAANYGIIQNKLPIGARNITDRVTTLRVTMIEGTLQSVTDTQFIAEEQVAIIGSDNFQNWEYVSYRDAVQDANGIWTISTMRRGRRGTDAPEISDSHVNGEFFIVADRAWLDRILLNLNLQNIQQFYRGVGRDDLVQNADTVALASAAKPLMPFAPYHLTAVVDGSNNIDFAWKRGDRLHFELTETTSWNSGTLNEDDLLFDLIIMDGPGGSDVRTIVNITDTETAQYDKADLITDIGIGTGVTTLNVGSSTTFTRPSGDFTTDGFLAGQTIETTGFTDGANNGVFTVVTAVALTLTIEETTLVTESGGGDENIDVIREDDLTWRVHQRSTQVGLGFASKEMTVPI